MIYWFTGQPSSGKTTLGNKLHKFLQTEKRNWRKSVFQIDGDDLRKLLSIKITQIKVEKIILELPNYG